MQRHLASGFISLEKLEKNIDGPPSDGVTCCDHAKASLLLKDNYSSNKVLLHFANCETDIPKLREAYQHLKPSAMLKSPVLNQKVGEMTAGLQ